MINTDSIAPDDFDFELGNWVVKHSRLKERFSGCDEWDEFEGESSTSKILGGFGNVEDNILHFPTGTVRALALRSYNAETKKWSIWWMDGRTPDSLGVPVVGAFSNKIGLFFADELIDSTPTKVRFRWIASDPNLPRWEQAFSIDEGLTWETNWTMAFSPQSA